MGSTALLSVIGLVIGVASLVVAMAVVSGYESTLKRTVIDVSGHVLVMKRGASLSADEFTRDVAPLVPEMVAATPFLYLEAVIATQGQISGIVIEGMDLSTVHSVLNLKSRLKEGRFTDEMADVPSAWIGKGMAKKYKLKVGDRVHVVLPVNAEFDAGSFRPRLGEFLVRGILDLGRQDYDARYLMTDLKSAQELAQVGDKVSGFQMRLVSPDAAASVAKRIATQFDYQYWARDWEDVNHNLFEAARLEKVIIFVVLLVLIIAAAFNVSSTLFVGVVKRYHDIGLLKTLGATQRSIRRVFLLQGLGLGLLGSVLGLILGLLLCGMFMWAQAHFRLIPAEVYKLDRIQVEIRFGDFFAIIGACLLICFVFSWAPARRGAELRPVEGLRYE
jgi:lipoprotein-releasing system permease protein